ncbi:MAG: 5-(carboxyamino)imidazole ribonucleotide synthase [Spirochaetia bacterium]|nr:5-(carboxyamino)imidazole ribonucleotide synthase [Spirochaetota bacterium]MCX8096571.1 5-(carboxyamino)imidazole ribonucleotide synthase [Spirochaetota bacterium]MDW8112875.1 5-(carboxyamino)imidazole ribonucleotide synthase [Spirochaetia bacterium]
MLDVAIGILGGGQLAKMTAQEARKMGIRVYVLDPTPYSPSEMVAEQIVGDFRNAEDIRRLAEVSDVITYDIESVETSVLYNYRDKVFPSPEILDIIQDKYKQKEFLKKNNIPTPDFYLIEDINSLSAFPSVQKARRGGYDGRGVFVIRSKDDIPNAIKSPFYIEEFIEIDKELAVMVARNRNGETKVFPVVEMVFNPKGNILDFLLAPARVSEKVEKTIKEIAIETIIAFNGVGIFGIEFFLSKDGRILVNEIAPRPHNSGHYTIEACATSQFEQHVRAVLGLPLGSTELLTPAVMINLLGEKDYYGKPIYEGIEEVLKIEGVYVHIYGKYETFPFRKMGHITIIDKNIDSLLDKARYVKDIVRVRGVRYEGRNNNG